MVNDRASKRLLILEFVDSSGIQRQRFLLLSLLFALISAPEFAFRSWADKPAGDSVERLEKEKQGATSPSDLATEPKKLSQQQSSYLSQFGGRVSGSKRGLSAQFAEEYGEATNRTAASWITVSLVAASVFLLVLFSRHASPRVLRDLVNRIANFRCPDCARPICHQGALNASLLRVSRTSPKWLEIDEDQLTPRQLLGPEAIWISTECPFCRRQFFSDEFGFPTSDPFAQSPQDEHLRPSLTPANRVQIPV